MAKAGWEVTVLEKNEQPGGRARQLKEKGFVFDMGPSWYWMPDVFEKYFKCFGKNVSDYYQLTQLDPSYTIQLKGEKIEIPANYQQLRELFESIESGSGKALDQFLSEAAYKYEVGVNKLVYKPGLSWGEFLDVDLIKGAFKLDVFTSMKQHINKYFKHPLLQQILGFPVLFLGALPKDIPALYSLMNYADIKLGTWYPQGGMYSIVEGMYALARECGVKFVFNEEIDSIKVSGHLAKEVLAKSGNVYQADAVIGAADYHHIETKLLQEKDRSYTERYWEKRVMAPSCVLFYIGINKKLKNVNHHTLFFDVNFDKHGEEIYSQPDWPESPLFYACAPSVTDEKVAPSGYENLFFLIPVAAGLKGDTETLREKYFDLIIERFEESVGEPIRDFVVYKKSYSVSDFINDYHSFKGNAYGLANTLLQTAILKPSCRSKKVRNLFYTGQLTVPGPGVPPALISGEVVAGLVNKYYS